MNKSKFVAFLVGLIGLAATLPAAAQASFYIGGSGGRAQAKQDICFDVAATYGTNVTCDRNGRGAWGGFVGLMFNPYFGIEGGYKDLQTILELNNGAGGTLEMKAKVGEFLLVGALPVDRMTLYLKAGGYRSKTTVDGTLAPSASSNTNQVTIGGGVSFDIWKHLGIRAEYQRYNNMGGKEVGFRTDVDVGMLGAYFKF